jgi:hypothetical protein
MPKVGDRQVHLSAVRGYLPPRIPEAGASEKLGNQRQTRVWEPASIGKLTDPAFARIHNGIGLHLQCRHQS